MGLVHSSAAQGHLGHPGGGSRLAGWDSQLRAGSGLAPRSCAHHCAVGPWCPHESQLVLALGLASAPALGLALAQLLPFAPPRLSSGLAPAAPRSLIAAAQPADLALNPSACNRLCSPEPAPEPGRAASGPVPAAAPWLCHAEPVVPFCATVCCATVCVLWCAVPRSTCHAVTCCTLPCRAVLCHDVHARARSKRAPPGAPF